MEADEYYNYYEDNEYGAFTAEMVSAFLHSTMLRPLYEAVANEEYQGYYQDGLTQTLEHLAHLPRTTDPRFVFAHLMTPHSPIILDQHGQPVDPDNYYDPEYYVGQLIYTNEQIKNVIDGILANSNTEPIIILQSDHGPRWTSDWEKVLNAYYLPGDGTDLLHPSISPVDSFRVILNHYFDAGFEQ